MALYGPVVVVLAFGAVGLDGWPASRGVEGEAEGGGLGSESGAARDSGQAFACSSTGETLTGRTDGFISKSGVPCSRSE